MSSPYCYEVSPSLRSFRSYIEGDELYHLLLKDWTKLEVKREEVPL